MPRAPLERLTIDDWNRTIVDVNVILFRPTCQAL